MLTPGTARIAVPVGDPGGVNKVRNPSILLVLDERTLSAEAIARAVAFATSRDAGARMLHFKDAPGLRRSGHQVALAAAEAETDLVVLASGEGLGELEVILHGSLSHSVLAETTQPVLLWRGRPEGLAPRRILVATDGGDGGRLEAAVALVAQPGSEVTVLHVPEVSAGIEFSWVEPADRARGTAGEVAERFRRSGFNAVPEVRWGPVAYTIVEAAAAHGCELIVLGSRPPANLAALLVGSVAQQVIQRSDRPVLLAAAPVKKLAGHGPAGNAVPANR